MKYGRVINPKTSHKEVAWVDIIDCLGRIFISDAECLVFMECFMKKENRTAVEDGTQHKMWSIAIKSQQGSTRQFRSLLSVGQATWTAKKKTKNPINHKLLTRSIQLWTHRYPLRTNETTNDRKRKTKLLVFSASKFSLRFLFINLSKWKQKFHSIRAFH